MRISIPPSNYLLSFLCTSALVASGHGWELDDRERQVRSIMVMVNKRTKSVLLYSSDR